MTAQPQLDCDGARALDAARDLPARVRELLASPALLESDKEVLRLVAGRSAARPIRAREICAAMRWPENESGRRDVTRTIAWLIENGALIGASRENPRGYFWIGSAEDQAAAAGPLRNELRALARRLRRICGPRATAELFKQLELELDREETAAGRQGDAEKGRAA
ncbi:MAG TPA: hypothetical protein VNL38_01465 [Candidatus Nitrosotenuis sp.]|nr:hypothetical protein [Candidatus Nitrosotenuis sp.]